MIDAVRRAIAWRRGALSQAQIPTLPIAGLVDEPELVPVSLVEYTQVYGDMPLDELITLCRLVRWTRPGTIFEIGTFRGVTTLQLAANSDASVMTLDLPPRGHPAFVEPTVADPELDVFPDTPGSEFRGTEYEARIRSLYGDSRTFDFSEFLGAMDFILVDASHHHSDVAQDARTALSLRSARGMVVWHDYASYAPGVMQALDELHASLDLVHLSGTSLVVYAPTLR